MVNRTYVYIDGFNLYYGAHRQVPNTKWLDLELWVSRLLPIKFYDVQKIKFFTANVSSPVQDPQKSTRQQIYYRALATTPVVEIVKGKFKPKTVKVQLNKDVKIMARVQEEKGTDVNLAVHLVNDAHLGLFDTAVVISNDSDLAEAVAITARDLKKEVFVFNPCFGNTHTKDLVRHVPLTHRRTVREQALRTSQFNPNLSDLKGPFSKPVDW